MTFNNNSNSREADPSVILLGPNNLYYTLGLSVSASDEDIKRAYRRLALQHHPDRISGDGNRFKATNYAYEVLSHPIRRRIYNRHGDAGLALYETVKSESAVNFILSKSRMGMLFFSMGFLGALLASLPALIVLKVARTLAKSWLTSLLPLWTCNFIIFAFLLSIVPDTFRNLQNPPSMEEERSGENLQPLARGEAILMLLVVFLVFSGIAIQQVLIVFRMDEIIRWPLWLVLLPYLLFLFLSTLLKLTSFDWSNSCRTTTWLVATLNFPLSLSLFVMFLDWRLRGLSMMSWTFVLLPLYSNILIDSLLQILTGIHARSPPLFWSIRAILFTLLFLVNLGLNEMIRSWHLALLPLYVLTIIAEIGNLFFWTFSYLGMRKGFSTLHNSSSEDYSSLLHKPGYPWAIPQLRILQSASHCYC